MNQGAGAWEIQFSKNSDFANAIKFGHSQDSPNLSGTPASSLRFIGLNTFIVFRDARRFRVSIQKIGAMPKQGDMVLAASVELKTNHFDIVQNYAKDGTWILVLKAKDNSVAAAAFKVEPRFTSPIRPHPQDPDHEILKLWRMRDMVEGMRYFKVVVEDYLNNKSWLNARVKVDLLGEVVAPPSPPPQTVDLGTSSMSPEHVPAANVDVSLGGMAADRKVAAESDSLAAHERLNSSSEPDLVMENAKGEMEAPGPIDPFESVWQYARGSMSRP